MIVKLLRRLLAVLILAVPLSAAAQQEAPAQEPPPGIVADAVTPPETLTEVQTGAYVLRLLNVSPRDGSFDVDMWIWFRWLGEDVRPDLSFELANGVIHSRTESVVEVDAGANFATLRFQGTVYQDFDLRRYPLDDHVLKIEIEDTNQDRSTLVYKPDGQTALDPAVKVAGWDVTLAAPAVDDHVYPTSYGYIDNPESSTYSRFTVPVLLERTSYGQLVKQFWASVLAVVLGLLAMFVKADDLDARFGLGVGSIFAASANAFIISEDLPKTSIVTLAEQLNLIAVMIIFLSVFVSIWSLRLRYLDRDEDSLQLDRRALVGLAVLFVVATAAVLILDLNL